MIELPKIKKRIADFLSKEDGKISKDKIIKAGIVLGTLSFSATAIQGLGQNAPEIIDATGDVTSAIGGSYTMGAGGEMGGMPPPESHISDIFVNVEPGVAAATHIHAGWHISSIEQMG